MPNFLLNRWHGFHVIFTFIFSLILLGFLAYYHWLFAAIGSLVLFGLVYFTYLAELHFKKELNQYIATLSHRIQKVGVEVLQQMPIGVLLFNEEGKIEWHNSYLLEITGEKDLIGKKVSEVFSTINLEELNVKKDIHYQDKIYEVEFRKNERLIFVMDVTEYKNLQSQYKDEQPVFGIIHLDNFDEVSQGMDDLNRSLLLTNITSTINDWASKLGIYIRRYTSDKFFIVTTQKVLEQMEKSRFDILDIVREMTEDNKIPFTLSIGIGAGASSLIEIGQMAQSSLDIALGRGGDQAAVKVGERLSFYGGKSNAVEKRTRVRARVIAHALKDLIQESDIVLIMGHKTPDMDAIGASIGILKAVRVNDRKGYVVLDQPNPSIEKLLDEVSHHKELPQYFLTPEKALSMVSSRTLLIMIDTHKPSMTIEPRLVEKIDRVVVIDHHRRGEEFVEDPVLIYIEPYASSTSELVTELLQYQKDKFSMDPLEATALLAGVVVDTKGFGFRTGFRTFDAASFLRRNGADPILVQKLLKEDIEQYIQKAELVKRARIVFDNIAIAVAEGKNDQLMIAQAADTLLNMSGIFASFVISVRTDGLTSISARSLGQVNVQLIMERMGGGGHLTNAAAQLEGVTVEEAETRLIEVLQTYQQEGGLTI
ncbi:DHH family phosphoesterase [Tepidibacillus infernus]|uniref:DHH family phosphoesterase n=1 Tax=Tepidibacillus infernus TaxID=1806172 RepID=UPI003B6BACF1